MGVTDFISLLLTNSLSLTNSDILGPPCIDEADVLIGGRVEHSYEATISDA